MPSPDAVPVLLRIPFSHFCRKAEWGLTQARIPYDALDVAVWQMRNAPRANPKGGTLPVLRIGDRLLMDSHDILVWADEHRDHATAALYPESCKLKVAGWESWAGTVVGPAVRRESYRALHEDPSLGKGYDLPLAMRLPIVARRMYLGILKHYKARRFEAEDPATLRQALARIAARLHGHDYLFGPLPTAADIATAALFEPLTLIAERKGYAQEPGWETVKGLIDRVRPATTTLRGARPVRGRDWDEWEAVAVHNPPMRP